MTAMTVAITPAATAIAGSVDSMDAPNAPTIRATVPRLSRPHTPARHAGAQVSCRSDIGETPLTVRNLVEWVVGPKAQDRYRALLDHPGRVLSPDLGRAHDSIIPPGVSRSQLCHRS